MEAGIMVVLLGGGLALSLGLAFGVLHVTVHAMAAVGVPATSNAALTAAARAPLASSRDVLEHQSRTISVVSQLA